MAKRKSWDEKNKYIHSSRKKVIDTVFGREDNTKRTFGYEGVTKKRKIGDVWEDEYWRYEQMDGFISKTSKNHEIYQDIKNYLNKLKNCKNNECTKEKYGYNDKQMIKKTGLCYDCIILIEEEIKKIGIWNEYEKWRMFGRALGEGKDIIKEMIEAKNNLKPYYENILEDGKIERWELPKPVDEIKKEMEEEILNIEKGLVELEEDITKFEKIIKEKNNSFVNKIFL